MVEEAWKSKFYVTHHYQGHWLVIRQGEYFSCNATIYKTKGGATRGAKAEYNKLHRLFEKMILKL